MTQLCDTQEHAQRKLQSRCFEKKKENFHFHSLKWNGNQGRRKVSNIGGANDFFIAAPSFALEILGVLDASILPILRNIWGYSTLAPPVPAPLETP